MPARERAIPMSAALRPWFSGLGVGTLDGDTGEQTVIDPPDTAAALVLRVDGGASELVVTGPRLRAMYHAGKPGPSCVRARLRPGPAAWVLGRTVGDLVDRAVPLSDTWGPLADNLARDLARLSTTGTVADQPVIEQLEEFVRRYGATATQASDPRGSLVDGATRLLSGSVDALPAQVQVAARRLDVGERRLRAVFREAVGLSPKQFVSVERVRAVLAGIAHVPLAKLAARVGYYDQSHMTAEFRTLMGVTPGAFRAGKLPQASPCRSHRS